MCALGGPAAPRARDPWASTPGPAGTAVRSHATPHARRWGAGSCSAPSHTSHAPPNQHRHLHLPTANLRPPHLRVHPNPPRKSLILSIRTDSTRPGRGLASTAETVARGSTRRLRRKVTQTAVSRGLIGSPSRFRGGGCDRSAVARAFRDGFVCLCTCRFHCGGDLGVHLDPHHHGGRLVAVQYSVLSQSVHRVKRAVFLPSFRIWSQSALRTLVVKHRASSGHWENCCPLP